MVAFVDLKKFLQPRATSSGTGTPSGTAVMPNGPAPLPAAALVAPNATVQAVPTGITGYGAGQATAEQLDNRELLFSGIDMSMLGNNRPAMRFPSTAIADPADIPNIDTRGLSNQAESFISGIEREIPDFMPTYNKVKEERVGRLRDDLSALGINAARQKQNIADMRSGPNPVYGEPGTALGDLSTAQSQMFKKAYDFALNNVDTQAAGAEVHLRDVMNATLDKAMGDVAHTYFQGSVDQALAHPDLVLKALNLYTDAAKADQSTALGQNQIIGENRRTTAQLDTDQAKTRIGEEGMDARATQNLAGDLMGKSLDYQSQAALQNARLGTETSQFNVGATNEAAKFRATADEARKVADIAQANGDSDAWRNATIQADQYDQLAKQALYKDYVAHGYNQEDAAALAGVNQVAASRLLAGEKERDVATVTAQVQAATLKRDNEIADHARDLSEGRITAQEKSDLDLQSKKQFEIFKQAYGTPTAPQAKSEQANKESVQRVMTKLGGQITTTPTMSTGGDTTSMSTNKVPLTTDQQSLYRTGNTRSGMIDTLVTDPEASLMAGVGAFLERRPGFGYAQLDGLALQLAQSQAKTTNKHVTSSGKLDENGELLTDPDTGVRSTASKLTITSALPADVKKVYDDYKSKIDDYLGTYQDEATKQQVQAMLLQALRQSTTDPRALPSTAPGATRSLSSLGSWLPRSSA